MTATLSTQIHRAFWALPLLAVGVVAVFAADTLPAPHSPSHATPASPDLPDGLALVAGLDCGDALQPAGALGLARMPGDIGPLGRRLRCAQ